MGDAYFLAQYQQNVKKSGKLGQIKFREDAVEVRPLSALEPKAMTVICGVDLGASLGKVGAQTVFSVTGRPPEDADTKKDWILDIDAGQWELNEIDQMFDQIEAKWGPDILFRVESNAIQLLIANDQATKHEVDPVPTLIPRPKRREKLAMRFNSGSVGCVEGLEEEMQEFWEWPDWYREDIIDSVDLSLGGHEEVDGEGEFDSMTAEGQFRGVKAESRDTLLKLLYDGRHEQWARDRSRRKRLSPLVGSADSEEPRNQLGERVLAI